jgi:hypothetical protein
VGAVARHNKLSAQLETGAWLSKPDPERRLDTYDVAAAREQRDQSAKRRLSDEVERVFEKACRVGDVDTARGLLTLLAAMLQRDASKFARDRRLTDELIERLTADLQERMMISSLTKR